VYGPLRSHWSNSSLHTGREPQALNAIVAVEMRANAAIFDPNLVIMKSFIFKFGNKCLLLNGTIYKKWAFYKKMKKGLF
jgi:hypothetical protein